MNANHVNNLPDEVKPCDLAERARATLATGTRAMRTHPVPAIVGAFTIGLGLGLLIGASRRERETGEIARELMDSVYGNMRATLPRAGRLWEKSMAALRCKGSSR